MTMADNQPNELSERELEILRLIATGAANKDIAQQLYISTNTVKVHLKNIFTKVGVSTRTEAALYAVRMGLAPGASAVIEESPADQPAEDKPAGQESMLQPDTSPWAEAQKALPVPEKTQAAPSRAGIQLWVLLGAIIILISLMGIGGTLARQQTPAATPSATTVPSPAVFSRWLSKASLPVARRSLAATSYEDQIYAIAGETTQGVSGEVDCYNPTSDTWKKLASKPLPVADVQAAVVGGYIFVPGGRTSSGSPSRLLEVFDTHQDQWEQRAPLPFGLSAYVMVAYEGRLYLFGGWDGAHYLNTVLMYEPARDAWSQLTPMPTARGFAGAAEAGGKIYVMGGYDGKHILAVNEIYAPDQEGVGEKPWSEGAPIPQGRYAMGVASVADIIHMMGGKGEESQAFFPLEYFPQRDEWENFDSPVIQTWSYLGLVSMETQIYMIGGVINDKPTDQNLAYQAIFTVIIQGTK